MNGSLTKASIPAEMFQQDVERYEVCPSCGNRYVTCVTIEELFNHIVQNNTVPKLPKDGQKS